MCRRRPAPGSNAAAVAGAPVVGTAAESADADGDATSPVNPPGVPKRPHPPGGDGIDAAHAAGDRRGSCAPPPPPPPPSPRPGVSGCAAASLLFK